MNRGSLWRLLGVAASLVLLLSGGEAAGQADCAKSLADVRAQIRAYELAWSSHDASSVGAFYTHDADMVMGNGPRIVGREAIKKWWARYFAAISDHRAGTFKVESLRLLASNVALANVSTLTAGRDEKGEDLPTRRARGTWILTEQGGQWLISALRGLPAEGDLRVEPGTDR
jgi:uncharacterized protein (TIGR02246 family)